MIAKIAGSKGYLIDGYPREVAQVRIACLWALTLQANCSYKCTGQEIFCNLYCFQGQEFEKEILPCSQILYFDVSDETMTERLLGRGKTSGRADDNIDTIKLRLDTFHKHSKPVVEAYKAKCCTVSISFLNELLPIYNIELLSLMLQNCNILCLFFAFADSSRTRPKRHFCRCVCRSRQIVIRSCT